MATGWAAWFGAALQAAAVGTLYALHELTPFRVLRLRPCPEYELVAAEPASRCLEVTQLKTQPVHKCEDFPRFGHFEWIASNPIDHVMPTRHAPWAGRHVAASSPDGPVQRFQWLMTAEVNRGTSYQHCPCELAGGIVTAFYVPPHPAGDALIVVDRHVQQPVRGDGSRCGVYGMPEVTGVVQNPQA
jgi:hypothetical protein